MRKQDFIEKYEFKIKYTNENIQYLNYVLEALKPFDNKVVNCEIKKVADKMELGQLTYWLYMTTDYWEFHSNKNYYQSQSALRSAYLDNQIAIIPTSEFIDGRSLNYNKLKNCLLEKIDSLKVIISEYILMLENLDNILDKLNKLNDEAKEVFSLIPPSCYIDQFVNLSNLSGKCFIRITEN